MLVGGARILILDEPTAVLTDQESERLLQHDPQHRRRAAPPWCSSPTSSARSSRHADRVTVMRGGKTVATADPRTVSRAGADADDRRQHRRPRCRRRRQKIGAPVLTVAELRGARADGHVALTGASFSVRAGEIYGIAGVGGNGQTELAEILMGVLAAARRAHRPRRRRRRHRATGRSSAARAGLASIPADRHTYGLAGGLSVADNFAVAGVLAGQLRLADPRRRAARSAPRRAKRGRGLRRAGRSRRRRRRRRSSPAATRRSWSSPANSPAARASSLAHSPSRGLDVRASAAVHERLRDARDAGAGVLLISEDLDEILLLSDRVGVMNRGRIAAEFAAPADRHAIGRALVHHG